MGNNRDTCECGKMCFNTKHDAMEHGMGLRKGKGSKYHVEAYKCSVSGFYHLTTTTTSKLKHRSALYKEARDGKYKNYKCVEYVKGKK